MGRCHFIKAAWGAMAMDSFSISDDATEKILDSLFIIMKQEYCKIDLA